MHTIVNKQSGGLCYTGNILAQHQKEAYQYLGNVAFKKILINQANLPIIHPTSLPHY